MYNEQLSEMIRKSAFSFYKQILVKFMFGFVDIIYSILHPDVSFIDNKQVFNQNGCDKFICDLYNVNEVVSKPDTALVNISALPPSHPALTCF